ncbi:hypothetical protein ACJRO7_011378 [Eucalyptus globulus]|uniref:Uncharacterized protein n=1 Tax=Eucalyptus globulus TaxID=34317 RepID=A0ABD3LKG0_EUCGL
MMDSSNKSWVKDELTLTAMSRKPVGPGHGYKLSTQDCAMGRHSVHLLFYWLGTGTAIGRSSGTMPVSECSRPRWGPVSMRGCNQPTGSRREI